ncbi:MAG: hypothetical protein ACYC1Z_05985 [Georgenia sp.]
MILRRGRYQIPKDVSDLLAGERALAGAELVDGTWAVATARALVICGVLGTARHPWHEIMSGSWDGAAKQFTVTWVDGARRPLALTTRSDSVESFAATLRERVQSSVVHAETIEAPSGARLSAYIRRGDDGELFSQLTVSGSLRDAEDQRTADELERRARGAVGLPT